MGNTLRVVVGAVVVVVVVIEIGVPLQILSYRIVSLFKDTFQTIGALDCIGAPITTTITTTTTTVFAI